MMNILGFLFKKKKPEEKPEPPAPYCFCGREVVTSYAGSTDLCAHHTLMHKYDLPAYNRERKKYQ